MVDPMTFVTVLGAGADALELLKSFVKTDELDRVLAHVDSVYGETTGLSAAQLDSWKNDKAFVTAFIALSITADWESHREALLRAVLGLTAEDPANPRPDERELADGVVAEIEYGLPEAKKGDSLVRWSARETGLAIESLGAVRPDFDWRPGRGGELFEELIEASPDDARELQRALRDKDAEKEIPALLRVVPPWLAGASGLAWEVLAAEAEGVGLWPEAGELWRRAFDTAGSDRVRALVWLTTALHIGGEPETGLEALAEAEALDPTHPLVLFARAEQATDPAATLALLDELEPVKDVHRTRRNLRRAVPLAELGHLEEAEEAITTAIAEDATEKEVREARSLVALAREERAFRRSAPIDAVALEDAAEHFLEMRDEQRTVGAHEGSVSYLSRAVDALLMVEERGRAISLMDPAELTEEELASRANRHLIAQQLLRAGRSDLAVRFLPDLEASEEVSRLLHAIATVQSVESDAVQLAEAVSALDEALDGPRRLAAAQARALASLRRGIDWSDEAEAILTDDDPGMAALMKAQWLSDAERFEEAEATLVDHIAEPRVQLGLLDIAQAREDDDRIVARARAILGNPSDPVVRLEAARALAGAGERVEAEAVLLDLARNDEVATDIRGVAFAEIAELLTRDDRNLDLLANCEEWLALHPQASNAAWGKVHSLFRLGRFEEAHATFEEAGLQADSLSRAQLLARVLAFALTGEEAIGRVVEVADSLERPDESIEGLALFLATGFPELSQVLAERLNPERFLRTFPETSMVVKFEQPDTAEALVALLEEIGGDRAQRIEEARHSIFDLAEAPVALLSIVAGRSVVETWRGLRRLPVGFCHGALLEDERAFAAEALTLGAVWDPSALYVAEALGGRLAEILGRLLPGSVVCQSTLDDIVSDSGPPHATGDTLGLDTQGRPFMTESTPMERSEEAQLVERVRIRVGILKVEPDTSPEDSGPAGRALRDIEDLRQQFLTVIASIAAAERLRLPVFSSDRFVRLTARSGGTRTFGPEAMIDALADRGEITADERLVLRQGLRSLGAMGTAVEAAEMTTEAEAADFALTRSLAFALLDDTPLKANEGAWYRTLLGFLQNVHAQAPERLNRWTARVLDALVQSGTVSHAQYGARLLAVAFVPGLDDQDGFPSALGRSVLAACALLGDRGEPVVEAARLLNQGTMQILKWHQRGVLVAQFANLMPAPESVRARFVIFEARDGRPFNPFG
jgi:tetratricopeptide (TPR) repeat protein